MPEVNDEHHQKGFINMVLDIQKEREALMDILIDLQEEVIDSRRAYDLIVDMATELDKAQWAQMEWVE